jgi:hypothetical protein
MIDVKDQECFMPLEPTYGQQAVTILRSNAESLAAINFDMLLLYDGLLIYSIRNSLFLLLLFFPIFI